MKRHLAAVGWAIILILALASQSLAAQCDAFDNAFLSKNGGEQSFLPYGNELLLQNDDAIPCLVNILAELKPRLIGFEFKGDDLVRFIQATGALRTILANTGPKSIRDFRDVDNLDVISSLAAGARSSSQNARINAALILSDVIDNTNICVIVDNLYDPSLGQSDYGKSGRLNLLGIAAVVAPWAYKENFNNLRKLQYAMSKIIAGERDSSQTMRVLDNLKERLDFQDKFTEPNKLQNLPIDLRQCYEYIPRWATNQLSYGN